MQPYLRDVLSLWQGDNIFFRQIAQAQQLTSCEVVQITVLSVKGQIDLVEDRRWRGTNSDLVRLVRGKMMLDGHVAHHLFIFLEQGLDNLHQFRTSLDVQPKEPTQRVPSQMGSHSIRERPHPQVIDSTKDTTMFVDIAADLLHEFH